MATPRRDEPSQGGRRRGLWIFLGSTALAVVAAFVLSWLGSAGGRAKALPLALPFVGMVWGLLQLITGRRLDELETWFARLPALARLPLGCLGAAGLLLVCALLVAELLAESRARGGRYLFGPELTALDLYWATFCNLVSPLPPELLPLPEPLRPLFTSANPDVHALVAKSGLLELRDRVYRERLELPVVL